MSKYFPPLQFPSRLFTLFADHLHNISKKIVKLDHFIVSLQTVLIRCTPLVIICCIEIWYQERRRNICGVLELKHSTSHFINSSCNRLGLCFQRTQTHSMLHWGNFLGKLPAMWLFCVTEDISVTSQSAHSFTLHRSEVNKRAFQDRQYGSLEVWMRLQLV